MVSIAASLARFYIKKGRAVGFVGQGEVLHHLPPDRGFRQMGKFLETLALCSASGNTSYPVLLSTHAHYLPRGSVIILITPSTQPELAVNVDLLLRMSLYPIIVLLDNESFGGVAGSDHLALSIQSMGVPVYRVRNGVDLDDVLNTGWFPTILTHPVNERTAVL